jgi:sec-independent protein translocase protein TatA
MFGGLGMGEMILIFLVVLLLFGAKRLPEIGSSLGKGIREFKSSVREVENELKQPKYTPPPPPPPQQEIRQIPQATPTPAQTTNAAPAPEKQAAQG